MNCFLELCEQRQPVNIDIVWQAMTKLAAAAADGVLPTPAFKMLQTQRVHQLAKSRFPS